MRIAFVRRSAWGERQVFQAFNLVALKEFPAAADGSQFVTISFQIRDFAGNTMTVSLDFNVTTTATLVKDMSRRNEPLFDVSATLLALLAAQ